MEACGALVRCVSALAEDMTVKHGWIVAVLLTAACRPNLTPLAPKSVIPAVSLCSGACGDSVSITYLGASGFVIRHGSDAVLTSPSFTHNGLLKTFLPFFSIKPDTALVRRMLADVRLDGVNAVLIGHAHYDHLLDAPAVAPFLPGSARFYGGPTAKNILWPVESLRDRMMTLAGADVGDRLHPGTWVQPPGSSLRFMALRANHPPNFYILGAIPYTYARGRVKRPRESLPRTPRGWKLGEPYAYLIDVMGADGKPAFRIFFQDAAAEPEFGQLPPLPEGDQRPVDVVIICAGNFDYATAYPTLLLRQLKPKHVVVGHWEDFFRAPLPAYQAIPLTDTYRLARRIQEEQHGAWVTPVPLASVLYRY